MFAEDWRDSGYRKARETSDGLRETASAGSPRGRTRGSGRSSSAWAWLSYRSRTCFTSEKPGQSHPLEMANSASCARSCEVVSMTKNSGYGHHGGCASSRKSVANGGWRKTARMATNHPQIWKKHGSHSWQGPSSNATGGTVCGEERRHSYGRRAHAIKLSCSQAGGNHRQWHGITRNQSMHGSSWRVESSRCRYVEKVDIASCTGTSLPNSGGQHGCAKSSESW